MKSMTNPYLPSDVCIPDGEPKVFDGRVYVYGSHDLPGTHFPCQGDYQCWSAPLNDLTVWKNEGIIYRRKQDPYIRQYLKRKVRLPFHQYLFAPDVVKVGNHWYLYYGVGMSGSGIGVAVANTPTGPFEYLGRVRYPAAAIPNNWIDKQDGIDDGDRALGDGQPMFTMPFGIPRYHLAHYVYDPAILYDNGHLFLYYGYEHCYVTELDLTDMRTVKETSAYSGYVSPDLVPSSKQAAGWQMKNGASIRKFGQYYYLTYYASRGDANALCYAMATQATGPFRYKGVLISLGDSAFHAPTAYQGNTHGGMFEAHGHFFQNYHRQSGSRFSDRQACMVELKMNEKGEFQPAHFTSQVQTEGGLPWDRCYSANTACVLVNQQGHCKKGKSPYFTYEGSHQVITNLRDGSLVGFKYFDFTGAPAEQKLILHFSGRHQGSVEVLIDNQEKAKGKVTAASEFCGRVNIPQGVHALYFRFTGLRNSSFVSFEFKPI